MDQLLATELNKYYQEKNLTIHNWPTLITTALATLDTILEAELPKDGKRCSLSFPDGLEPGVKTSQDVKGPGSRFQHGVQRMIYNQEQNYIVPILQAIETLIKKKAFGKEDELYTFLHFLFQSSGPALIEVIGESYYQKKLIQVRRNSKRIFKRRESHLLYNYLLTDTKDKTVDGSNWPLLVSVAKQYADECFIDLEAISRKQIIVEALSNLVQHLGKENGEILKIEAFILSNITPILDMLCDDRTVKKTQSWCCIIL